MLDLQFIKGFYFSFPVRLFILHMRNHHLLLLLWLMLMAMITGHLGNSLGMKFLFLDPEYLGKVNFLSFYIIGFSFGGFLMAWNLTVYILKSFRFPFLASLQRPFGKFCINNTVLPIAFLVFYLSQIIRFQWYNEYAAEFSILYFCLGFFCGLGSSLGLTAIYFNLTNKDIFNFLKTPKIKELIIPDKKVVESKLMQMYRMQLDAWRVDYYLNDNLKTKRVRDVRHYDPDLLTKVFYQNHINSLIVQMVSIGVLVILGMMIENPFFRIPAGASIFIFFAVLTSLLGAFSFWLRGWRTTAVVLLFFGVNYLTTYPWMAYRNMAYGLNYEAPRALYSIPVLEKLSSKEKFQQDSIQTQHILEKWKIRANSGKQGRPKLMVVCVSGGGLRAGVWGMHVLQEADSLSHGKLMKNTVLFTGASGGMFGAAYLRELYLQQQLGNIVDYRDRHYLNRLSGDMLNPVVFTIITNDIFFPLRKFHQGKYTYYKDRGYIFEKALLENTEDLLNKSIADYRAPEQEALIPLIFITPVVINDAKTLVISPQPVSYMTRTRPDSGIDGMSEIDGIDFGKFFAEQDGYNLQMSNALRMNGTYPYILPNVHLPTIPEVEVVDAGWKDNYGLSVASRFVFVFRNWILENTSGVIFLSIRDSEKKDPLDENLRKGLLDKFFNPLGIAVQQTAIQDHDQDRQLDMLSEILGKDKMHLVRFVYKPSEVNQRASMSLHLTAREKSDILRALELKENQESMKRLLELLE